MQAVATSAVRDAADGRGYVAQIADEMGLEVRVIDGDEEARLTYLGVTSGLDVAGGALVCDLGGGSCELIAADDSGVKWSHSIQIGSGRLTEQLVHSDPPTRADRNAIELRVLSELQAHLQWEQWKLSVFTGGTASHVALLAELQGRLIHIDHRILESVEGLTYSLKADEIASQFRISPERAAVLPAGFTALRTIAGWSRAGELFISRLGIREGLILARLVEEKDQAPIERA